MKVGELIEMLAEYQQQGKEVWLELGLQSANNHTLKRINRGHDFAAFQQALARAHQHGLKVCAHLILGLPGEGPDDYMASLNAVLEEQVAGIKLHPLHVVDGSSMAKAWRAGRLSVMTQADYVEQAVRLIRHTPPQVVYHRVSAHAHPPVLLAPEWCQNKWLALTAIAKKLASEGPQGSALSR